MTRRHSAFGSFTILNDSSTTLHSDSPDLPHHATHAHETRSSCFDHAAHSSSKDLRREHVVAEPRVQPTFLCRAASPAAPLAAGASRQRATHVFAACRVPPAPCTERCVLSRRMLGCAPVLCFRALLSSQRSLVFGRIRLKSSKNITKKYKQPPLLEP